MNSTNFVPLTALALSTLGCASDADIPDVPDLQALQRAYDEPSAALDTAALREISDTFPQLESLAAAFSSAGPLIDRIEDARTTAGRRASPGIELRGGLSLTLPCPGRENDVTFNEGVNGYLALELAVEESRIRRSFWATARHCLLRGMIASVPLGVEIDGSFAFDLGTDIPLWGSWTRGRTLVVAEGTISFGDVETGEVSARFGEGSFEYLHELAGGTVVLQLGADGLSVRGRDGTWVCGKEVAACAGD